MSTKLGFMTNLLKMKGLSKAVIISTAFISTVIVFVTIYASQVGNFVISVSNSELEIYISETADFKSPESVITAPAVKDMDNTTLANIDVDLISKIDGSSNTTTYIAYSFYLKNYSKRVISYSARLRIDAVYKGVDAAMWVLVIEKREESEERKIYAKTGSDGEPESVLGFETTPFLSDRTIFDYNVSAVRRDEIIRYSIIIWLEGNDPDCNDDIRDGSIRISLNFAAF